MQSNRFTFSVFPKFFFNESRWLLAVTWLLWMLFWSFSGTAESLRYRLDYTAKFLSDSRSVQMEIKLGKNADLVRWIRLRIDPEFHTGFKGRGSIERDGNYVRWMPDGAGANLSYNVAINHRRRSGRYDALFTDDWAVFRGDDLVPPVRVRTAAFAQSRAKLHFEMPKGWSVATPYPKYRNGAFKVDHAERRFDRPTGWMVAGKIGVKRETIKGIDVAVAGPVGESVRRMDILALLNWNLPKLADLFPGFPSRILLVSAGNPMWRGALSGPDSLYVHADRPLVSENGTSTFIHELMHVAMSAHGEPGSDWLVEGLAEFYSLELLSRSGTITPKRYEKAHKQLADWGLEAGRLDVKRAHGAVTAKAVGVLRRVDAEIRRQTGNGASLDNVVRTLVSEGGKISLARVRTIAERVTGVPLKTLGDEALGLATKK